MRYIPVMGAYRDLILEECSCLVVSVLYCKETCKAWAIERLLPGLIAATSPSRAAPGARNPSRKRDMATLNFLEPIWSVANQMDCNVKRCKIRSKLDTKSYLNWTLNPEHAGQSIRK